MGGSFPCQCLSASSRVWFPPGFFCGMTRYGVSCVTGARRRGRECKGGDAVALESSFRCPVKSISTLCAVSDNDKTLTGKTGSRSESGKEESEYRDTQQSWKSDLCSMISRQVHSTRFSREVFTRYHQRWAVLRDSTGATAFVIHRDREVLRETFQQFDTVRIQSHGHGPSTMNKSKTHKPVSRNVR